jgi:hypothetical protein
MNESKAFSDLNGIIRPGRMVDWLPNDRAVIREDWRKVKKITHFSRDTAGVEEHYLLDAWDK